MKQNVIRSFRKSRVVFVFVCLILTFPAFLGAQMQMPVQKLPNAVQSPPKSIQINRQQAQEVFYRSVRVEAVQLWPAQFCDGTWQARIANPGNFNIGKSLAIPYQYNVKLGKWEEGPSVEFNLSANQNVTVQGKWSRKLYSRKFKVAFKPVQAAGTYAEKIIDWPAPGNPSLAVDRFEVGNNYVAAHINNRSQTPGCDLIVQSYTAKSSSPETYAPAGGAKFNIAANATTACRSYVDVQRWKQGWDFVKIVVFGENNTVLAEKVFPLQ